MDISVMLDYLLLAVGCACIVVLVLIILKRPEVAVGVIVAGSPILNGDMFESLRFRIASVVVYASDMVVIAGLVGVVIRVIHCRSRMIQKTRFGQQIGIMLLYMAAVGLWTNVIYGIPLRQVFGAGPVRVVMISAILYYVTFASIKSLRTLKWILGCIGVGSGIALLLSLRELPESASAAFRSGEGLYTKAPLAFILGIAIVMMIPLVVDGLSRVRRIAIGVVIVVEIFGLVVTLVRSAWIGLLVGGVVVARLMGRGVAPSAGRRIILWGYAIVCVVTLIAVQMGRDYGVVTALRDRIFFILLPLDVGSVMWRAAAWNAAWREFWAHPILGAGLGTGYEFYVDGGMGGFPAAVQIAEPHNALLWVASQMGVVGVLIVTRIAITFWRLAGSVIEQTQDKAVRQIAIGLMGAIAFAVTAGMFDNYLVDTLTGPYMWVILGLVSAIYVGESSAPVIFGWPCGASGPERVSATAYSSVFHRNERS